jgi:hypothetical protein
MNKTIYFSLIGASSLAFTSPVFARDAAKSNPMTTHLVTGVGEQSTAPAALREREPAPEQLMQVYSWNASAGLDRASSPYQGGGY